MTARPLLCWAAFASAALGCRQSATERPPGPIVSALLALGAEFGAGLVEWKTKAA